jgi:hypothetical protein
VTLFTEGRHCIFASFHLDSFRRDFPPSFPLQIFVFFRFKVARCTLGRSLTAFRDLSVNSNPRQINLLDTVRRRGSVTVEALADMLGVTLQTVRRDVQRLADQGLLTRFHGGVRVPSSTTENIGYQQRETLNAEGKARIARRVAELVPNDCSLILNIGTTTRPSPRRCCATRGCA